MVTCPAAKRAKSCLGKAKFLLNRSSSTPSPLSAMRDAVGVGYLGQSQSAGTDSPSPLASKACEFLGLLLDSRIQLAGLSGEQSPPSPTRQTLQEEERDGQVE